MQRINNFETLLWFITAIVVITGVVVSLSLLF